MPTADVSIKVQFYDLDPMQVVWHGNYARYFEQARCALMERIGYSFREMKESGYVWPIIDLHVRYARPIRLGQEIVVSATVTEFVNRLKIDYQIRDPVTADVLTRATTVQVAVHEATGEMRMESPAVLIDKLRDLP